MLSLLTLVCVSRSSKEAAPWCRSQYLIPRHLAFAKQVRTQLVGTCHSAGELVSFYPLFQQ